MTEPITLTFSIAELRVIFNALQAFRSDFGHDEQAVIDHIDTVVGRLEDAVTREVLAETPGVVPPATDDDPGQPDDVVIVTSARAG